MFFSGGRYWLSEPFTWPGRCLICDVPGWTAQRLIDRKKGRTFVHIRCLCGFDYEYSRETDPEHDYYQPPGSGADNGHLTDDQAKRLAELINYIDQEENQQ